MKLKTKNFLMVVCCLSFSLFAMAETGDKLRATTIKTPTTTNTGGPLLITVESARKPPASPVRPREMSRENARASGLGQDRTLGNGGHGIGVKDGSSSAEAIEACYYSMNEIEALYNDILVAQVTGNKRLQLKLQKVIVERSRQCENLCTSIGLYDVNNECNASLKNLKL